MIGSGNIKIQMIRSFIMLLLLTAIANAHWKPEYAQNDKATKDWFESRTLTPAAEAEFHFHSCCNNADRVQTQFKVNKVNGADEWYYLDDDKHFVRVPDYIIHWDEHAPDGSPVLFAVGGRPVCFFPPDGGI